jgi:predicted Zn-dependent protease
VSGQSAPPPPSLPERLLAQLAAGRDGPLLRLGLAGALVGSDPAAALDHARAAVAQAPENSAAWKLLGRAALAAGDVALARQAWSRGVEVARRGGDLQALREMEVFMRRLPAPG